MPEVKSSKTHACVSPSCLCIAPSLADHEISHKTFSKKEQRNPQSVGVEAKHPSGPGSGCFTIFKYYEKHQFLGLPNQC